LETGANVKRQETRSHEGAKTQSFFQAKRAKEQGRKENSLLKKYFRPLERIEPLKILLIKTEILM